MIVLVTILALIGRMSLIVSGLKNLFGSTRRRPDDSGTHITYNITISNSFNGGNHDSTKASSTASDGEFSSILNNRFNNRT